jgi:acyl-CoA hydrolase
VPTIADTRFQMVQLVFPEHTNQRGTLYGGRMMSWIATAGTLAASRVARGPVVLGAMDDLDFLTPIHLGEIVTMEAQVEAIGRSSLEVGVAVHAELPQRGVTRRATSSHLAFVSLDEHERPRQIGRTIAPGSEAEAALLAEAEARKAARLARLRAHRDGVDAIPEAVTRHTVTLSRLVRPEDALAGTLMFAGQLLEMLDEVASITAVRYCRGATVTASLDTVYFHYPLRLGQIVDFRTVLTHVARSSMEIGVRVDAEDPRSGARHHTCTAFLTMVHLDDQGRPAAVAPFTPVTDEERRLWDDAEVRIRARKARIAQLRASAGPNAR